MRTNVTGQFRSRERTFTLCGRFIPGNESAWERNVPVPLPGIERVTALKILGVTITGKLSLSEHVRDVVRKCAQSLHIIKVLRCHGMNDQALQAVYRSVVIAKLLNTACAWWGFTTADDRNCVEAVVRWMGQR